MKTILIILIFIASPIYSYEPSIIVLMYHRFGESHHPTTNISTELFENQMEYLKKKNFKVFPLSRLVSYFEESKELPDKSVFITIDDAYKSVYEKAFPILKKYNFPFSVFVSTKFISDDENSDFMNWQMLNSLSKENVEILNHTHSHENLITLEPMRIREEFEIAEKHLKKNIKNLTKITSYPFGESDEIVEEVVKELNYKIAFSQFSSPIHPKENKLMLPRFSQNQEYGRIKRFEKIMESKPLLLNNFQINKQNLNKGVINFQFDSKVPSKKLNCFIDGDSNLKKTSKGKTSVIEISNLKNRTYRINCTYISEEQKLFWCGKILRKTNEKIFINF